jgi:hypothetical protein
MFGVGDAVVCGDCGKETTVKYRSTYANYQVGYGLHCGHRNGFCSVHKKLVMDASDTGKEVHPMCIPCVEADAYE